MTVNADALRRLADVVNTLQETPIDVDSAQLLDVDEDAIRGQLAVTVPNEAELDLVETMSEISNDVERAQTPVESATDLEDEDPEDDVDDVLDHTSTEDLQRAYDEADGNISTAAERFEIGYTAVFRRMKKHGVHEPNSGDNAQSDTAEDVTVDALEDSDDEDDVRCDGCGQTFESRKALQGHGPKSCEEGDADPVDLPDGVTAADVEQAVAEHETLGDVSEELGVSRGRARTITVALGCYGDVRDVPARGDD
ncbi:hypothetical protein GS429_08525 [Natronorubrum sp. JWXQ-INN-674]|uniref:C2H2-type domain-containing protein n=1 Tax=Natronorubrum halalkaliphilum TaxID=2691917 RepID=A0A6B0VKL9_9EURY|nr:hypothetical protein [Natronorubrum halalkaliphilum]MXV62104.1 hypothetical protein [Natronorubrum halalkaliphilum]